MEFKEITSLQIHPYASLYGGRLGTIDNPLGYVETYIYEKSVLKLSMRNISYGLTFYDIEIGGILTIRFDNSKVTEKYLDLTELLAANYTQLSISQLTTTQTNYTDNVLLINIYDEYGGLLTTDAVVLRAVKAFNGSKSTWLPDELKLIDSVPAAISVNPNGAFTFYATGITSGTTSLSFTACKTFTDGEIVKVANTQWNVTEECRIKTVSDCGHVQLWWLSKTAGGWKTAAFELLANSEQGGDATDFLREFTAMQGKRAIGKRSLIYRDCTFRTASYLSDIVSSDMVLYRYTDQYNTNYEQVVKVEGSASYSLRNRTNIELTITDKEVEWL